MKVTSGVERDGTVGGDGACPSWSFTWTNNGTEWTTYVYPVYMPERFSDWAERDLGNDYDVETVDVSEDGDTGPYEWLTLDGCPDYATADAYALTKARAMCSIAIDYGGDW